MSVQHMLLHFTSMNWWKCKKEYKPGNEGISNIKITSNAVDYFHVASAALLYCTRHQLQIITGIRCPEHLFKHLELNKKLLTP